MINHKIKNSLVWDEDVKIINDEYGNIPFSEKPNFSFSFDSLKYNWSEQCKIINVDGIKESTQLTDSEQNEVKVFIENMRESYGIRKHCADEYGRYIGLEIIDNVKYFEVDFPPSESNVVWDFETKKWKVMYFYDKNGFYTTNQEDYFGFTIIAPEIKHFFMKFDIENNIWIEDITEDNFNSYKENELINIKNKLITLVCNKVSEETFLYFVNNSLEGLDDFDKQLIQSSLTTIRNCENVTDITTMTTIMNNFLTTMMTK